MLSYLYRALRDILRFICSPLSKDGKSHLSVRSCSSLADLYLPLGCAVQCRGHLERTPRHPHALRHDTNTGLIQQSSPVDLSLYHLDLEEITSSSTKRPETIDEGVPSRPFHLRANTLELALLILPEYESRLGAFSDALVLDLTLEVLIQLVRMGPARLCGGGEDEGITLSQAGPVKPQARNFFEALWLIYLFVYLAAPGLSCGMRDLVP